MSDKPPPPRASPRPDVVEMGDAMTPSHGIATPAYVQRKVAEAEQSMDSMLRAHDNRLTLRSIVVAVSMVALGVTSVLIFVDNRVQAQTDAGVKVHEARIGTLEQQRAGDRAETNLRFERLEQSQARTEKKLDALLDRLSVPNPAPAPKDGGP